MSPISIKENNLEKFTLKQSSNRPQVDVDSQLHKIS